MSWSYLQIVNRVLTRLNEVNLTSSNFNSVVGFQSAVQGFVNDALNDIYDAELHWPFLWARQTDTLTNYTQKYSLPANYTEVDWDSFYLVGNYTATPPWPGKKLQLFSYHDWQENRETDDERIIAIHNLSQGNNGSAPDFVIPYQDMQSYLVSYPPDTQQTTGSAQFTLMYDYWFKPTDLVLYSDITILPDMFSKVIFDGVSYYAYMFRDNVEEAQAVQKKFTDGISQMRTRLINKEDYMRSDQLPSRSYSTVGYV